jgi:hypothetical protein
MSSFRRGWLDRQRGFAFASAYDSWTPQRQLAYERGRRAAALASSSTVNMLPSWALQLKAMPRNQRAAARREVR